MTAPRHDVSPAAGERHRVVAGGLLRWSQVERVAGALRAGGLAVLPTETGYLLAARATDRDAVLRVFAAKDRPTSMAMHVACASPRMAGDFATLSELGRRLLTAFTPGPLTVVDRRGERLTGDLVTVAGTVGLRLPDAGPTLQVVEALGEPVTATSLNRSGEETGPLDAGLASLVGVDPGLLQIVDAGPCARYEAASTLVRVTGDAPEILRAGPVTAAEIAAVAGVPVVGRDGGAVSPPASR